MSGHLDLLDHRRKTGKVTDDAVSRAVANIRSAVQTASTLTQQLLAFSRKQRLEGRLVNLNGLVAGITDLVRETLGRNIELRVEPQADLGNCQLDPTQLEMAVLNVLVNARDAMPEGGTVTLRTRSVEVDGEDASTFIGLMPGRYVSLSITDTGTGIAPEIVGRVMDPFFTTKEEGKGTGLGLSMVHGFAKQSGGTASVESEPGTGTTVRMYFPATDATVSHAALAVPARTTPRAADHGGSETILVVDDRIEVAQLSSDMLQDLGYRVRMAGNAREALALIEDERGAWTPDLLFSDLIMPGGMNGFGLAREMRRRIPGIRVLLTTGFAGSADGRNSDQGTEFEVLKKPYRLADLARRVRMVLDDPVTGVSPDGPADPRPRASAAARG